MPYELLIGCGNNLKKQIAMKGDQKDWHEVVTLDIDPLAKPDILWDLNVLPIPVADESFMEIHAYEVLEHVGKQGDWKGFFDLFAEFYRILKPGGMIMGTCPSWDSAWAWGDPGHTRIISPASMTFLSQRQYTDQIGQTAMTDYRHYYKADFEIMESVEANDRFVFVLRKV